MVRGWWGGVYRLHRDIGDGDLIVPGLRLHRQYWNSYINVNLRNHYGAFAAPALHRTGDIFAGADLGTAADMSGDLRWLRN